MNSAPLDLFVRQLACWAEDLLRRSRSPLRKIDCSPEVLTELGPLHPDLIFWVNRDSCMAGGVVLIPSRDATEAEEHGRYCSIALGLRYFVIWGAREISFWEIRGEGLSRHKLLPAPAGGSDAATFKQTLASVLEELKYLTVAGTIPPGALSPYYFANLCQGVLDDTATALTETMRMARSEHPFGEDTASPEQKARDKALLTLARLTALLHFDQLPTNVQPEGLERAMFFALDSLPDGLRSVLAPADKEPSLPQEVAVRFHHLLRRLVQLGICSDGQRLPPLLDLLLTQHCQDLGLSTFSPDVSQAPGAHLWVNARSKAPGAGGGEVAAPAALAFSALLHRLQQRPEPSPLVADCFLLPGNIAPQVVVAALLSATPIPARDRTPLLAKLRVSWPTRRFNLPATLPRWGWELIHLMGLAAADAILLLRTPGGWLTAPFAQALLDVVRGEGSIREIRRIDGGELELRLVKDGGQEHPLHIIGPGAGRRLDGSLQHAAPASLLALAIGLPDPLWELIADRQLQPTTTENWPCDLEYGVVLFTHSSLGRTLWQVLGMGQPLPGRSGFPANVATRGFPLPSREVLAHLQQLAAPRPGAIPSRTRIDAELAPWFAVPEALPPADKSSASPPTQKGTEHPDYASLLEVLQREVFQDGVPSFPEHYLFAHFRPQLQEYRFTPPLTRVEQFFGQVTFEDRSGQRLLAPSMAMAQALELVAARDRQTAGLPTDPQILQDILDRYLQDLRSLHGALQRRVHALLADARQARKTARKLWENFGLPSPESFLPPGK